MVSRNGYGDRVGQVVIRMQEDNQMGYDVIQILNCECMNIYSVEIHDYHNNFMDEGVYRQILPLLHNNPV